MKTDLFLKSQDRSISFRPIFVPLTGSITGALMLSQATYWQNRCQHEDGFWWKTYAEWSEETGMTRRELDTARRNCGSLLEVQRRGNPSRNWYRVNSGLVQFRLAETYNCNCPKAPIANGGKRHLCTKSTSEITSETTLNPPTPQGGIENDAAVELVNAYREKFAHYQIKVDPKFTKKELAAATSLLKSATANEILDLAGAALNDKWSGNKRAASTLQQLYRHFSELRAQFGHQSPSVDSSSSAAGDWNRDKTVEEVQFDWRKYLAGCQRRGQTPDTLPDDYIEILSTRPGALEEFLPRMPQDVLPPINLPPPALLSVQRAAVSRNGHNYEL